MNYITEIQSAASNPEKLEQLYQAARQANQEGEFRVDLLAEYEKSPENLLLSAWHSRFEHVSLPKAKRAINWGLALVLGVISGLSLWAISDPKFLLFDRTSYLLLFWAPICTVLTLIFLSVVSKKNYGFAAVAAAGLVIACVYVLLITPIQAFYPGRDYHNLMMLQLPLLCWIAIGVAVMGFRSTYANRFAFLIKSIEVMIAAGIYLIFGLAFGGITLGLFAALNITPPDLIMRLFAAGGIGLLPILAVATMYDPLVSPEAQDFNQGLSKFIFTMMRLLLPLTIVVLVIYIFVIPFNFMAPFQNRNLLIVYNVMQFAIIGLLIGVTPLKVDDLSQKLQLWLRRGIIAVAILALLISLYALSAVLYRTAIDHLTLNRTTIIGWNIINVGILVALLVSQFRKGINGWHERLQGIFSKATTAYLVWSLLLIVLLPLIFR